MALVGEIDWLRRTQSRANRACAMLDQKKQERDRLSLQSPAPTLENERAIATALADAQQALALLRDELGENKTLATTPAGSIEAFFDLSRFVEETRQKARDAKIAMKPAEHFGFASYANEGPAPALVPVVHRQRAAAGCIMDALIQARPLALLAVRRNQPGVAGDDKQSVSSEDYFVLPPHRSLREPGLIDSDAFRVEFSGQTAVLRQFLNGMKNAPLTMVVRSVEVEPFRGTTTSPRQADPVALHRPQVSKFAVTLEIPLIASSGTSP
jgi:hypothetical protein